MPRIAIPGADPTVVAEIERAVERLDDLASYRFVTQMSGGDLEQIPDAAINLATRGVVEGVNARSVDLRLSVEIEQTGSSTSVTSVQRFVRIGDEGWVIRSGSAPELIDDGSPTHRVIDFLLPRGLADRMVKPFVEGFERVGEETHDGVDAIRYRATAGGLIAYQAAGYVGHVRTADLWIAADGDYLLGVDLVGRGPGGIGWSVTRIDLADVNDPDIEIERPD